MIKFECLQHSELISLSLCTNILQALLHFRMLKCQSFNEFSKLKAHFTTCLSCHKQIISRWSIYTANHNLYFRGCRYRKKNKHFPKAPFTLQCYFCLSLSAVCFSRCFPPHNCSNYPCLCENVI